MPIVKPQGLRGLQGLGSLSKAQYDSFINKNKDLISQHGYDPVYINNLYSNKQFIDKYGVDKFKAIPDIDMRNALYKDDIVNTEFTKVYSPFNADGTRNNKKGLGADFEKYNQLSTDAKLKLMESDYLSPSEFESNWQKRMKNSAIERTGTGNTPNKSLGAGLSLIRSVASLTNAISEGNGLSEAMGLFTPGGEEAAKKVSLDKNQKILDNIYNNDADSAAKRFAKQVGEAYQDPTILGMSDSQVKQAFKQAVTPNSYKGNLGISEFASHLNSSEMEDFSIDDMRQVLAKKKVYDANMSPEMAATALNNDAKRYLTDHQGSFKRFGLFLKDVGISAMSYSADKLNGIAELYRAGQDAFQQKPIVMVDDKGDIIDPNKTKVIRDKQGGLHYQGNDGQIHSVHQEQVDYTTLHNMGKNPDGSDIQGAFGVDWMTLNPQYWTRAEQFGTLDENEQKQYEKLGSSPYKVAYNPNEDSDLMYEAFKMASFGIADAASQLIPYGVGLLGKSLSTASKVGRVVRGFGKVLDTTGKMLTAETKVGQIAQGTAGALGIAYAYNRGAFQETLQQNLANAEEALNTTARNDIYNRYQTDKEYKADIDKAINHRVVALKQNYLAQVQRDGGMRIADMNAVDKMLRARAQEEVLQGVVQNEITRRKSSKEYADLQQEAINSAGDAALNTFFPEAIKYGFVNTLGYRKFLYTNPSGLTQKLSSSLKGLKEVTTSAGRKRLTTDASKFLTRADKWKEFGKTIGSQTWGGVWTNGTDDMQVDAAERINEDSFNRYLNAYQTGEALANTYGFAEGLYSYMKGLQNSMGQETTLNAAVVGGLGSVVNFTPNFANIVRLATKEGREAYKNNFRREIERDTDGNPVRNADGTVKYKDLGKWNDWRGQLNYFIQNGVLNSYYGKKQSERDLQSHADYVNNLLDEYNDFKDIEDLVASNIASENLENEGDRKTMDFIKALHSINTLNHLGNDSNDPTTMSSVVQNAKALIDKASQLNLGEGNNPFSEEEINNLLSQYYASHPELEQSETNSQKALYDIAQNAQKLKEASDAFDKAEEEIQKIEKNRGEFIDYAVRTKMKIQQALNGHWLERKEQMQSELDDSSSDDSTSDARTTIAAIGGTKNAQSLSKVYDKQYKELSEEIKKQKEKAVALDKEYTKTVEEEKAAQEAGNSDAVLDAQKKQKEAKAKWEAANAQVNYLETLQSMSREKNSKLSNSLASLASDDFKDPTDKILTADEIFSLDPVTRARMMREENRSLYSKEQQREIEKLEQRLLMRDADALQKVQDIALLTQRINKNQDAYSRMAKNPEAAAVEIESQRAQAADTAYRLINQRNAETTADYINQFDEAMKNHSDVSEENKEEYVFKVLRRLNPGLLDVIEEDSLLPKYQKQVADAKEWTKVVGDIDAVISQSDRNDAWKENILKNIDSIVESSNTKDEIIKKLEKVIDDTFGTESAKDFDYILDGLAKQGYQRDATVLESRKQRKLLEEEKRRQKEQQQKSLDEAAKEAAEKKANEVTAEDMGKVPTGGDGESITLDNPFDLSDVDNGKEINTETSQVANPTNGEINEETGNPGVTEREGTGEKVPMNDESSSQPVEEEDLHQIPDGTFNAQKLLEDDYKNQPIDSGEIYYGTKENPKKGRFYATREGDKISFTIDSADGKKETLSIAPNEYEVIADEQETKKNEPFIANSIEKIDGDWYFNGNFAGDNKQTQVKVKDNFDIDKAIERQQAARKAELGAKDIVADSKNLIDKGDTIQTKSETINEQAENNSSNDNIQVSDTNDDAATENGRGLQNIETTTYTLGGNAMSRYEPKPLEEDGILVNKKGTKGPNDVMNQYYAWMDAAGIKLQNIIDQELARIIKKNPHAKVKFMTVVTRDNATHDNTMTNHLMLVLDYDNSINKGITSIHNDDNGGVIESNGKKYLVIGTASYGDNNLEKRKLYFRIGNKNTKLNGDLGLIIPARKKFFDEHPNERFYVDEQYTTEIVPSSQIPGYIVRQLTTDKNPEYRNIKDLLADKERNPMGYDMKSLSWGIQEKTQFLLINAKAENVMVPRNPMNNLGSAFVLMPASNGKMVPSYLKVLKYTEMKDGVLKDRINSLLQEVVAPNYNTRINAAIELSKIFYFDKDGDNILVGKDDGRHRNEVSLVHGDNVLHTFVLNSDFDRAKFMQAFEDLNPRINITADVLMDDKALDEYNEAGALMTDAALFGTAGSSYSIYALDSNGKMIMPEQPTNNVPKASNSDFKDSRQQIVFNKEYYRWADGNYYSQNGKLVTDEKKVNQLQHIQNILNNELSPVEEKGTLDYYILSTGEHPSVISVDRNSKNVKELPEEQAKELIKRVEERKAKEARENNALDVMDSSVEQAKLTDTGNVELDSDSFTIDEETGEMIPVNSQESLSVEEESPSSNEGSSSIDNMEDTTHISTKTLSNDKEKSTQSFVDLMGNKKYTMNIFRLIRNKWKDAPRKIQDLEKFLRDKNIEVDSIGTSKADIDAWIKTIEDCR